MRADFLVEHHGIQAVVFHFRMLIRNKIFCFRLPNNARDSSNVISLMPV